MNTKWPSVEKPISKSGGGKWPKVENSVSHGNGSTASAKMDAHSPTPDAEDLAYTLRDTANDLGAARLSDAIYETFRLQAIDIPGAAPHPTKLVRPAGAIRWRATSICISARAPMRGSRRWRESSCASCCRARGRT